MKILYISHVNWDWIKQRPQFLAEEMAQRSQITYVYKQILGRKRAFGNPRSKKIKYCVVYQLPFSRLRFIRNLNKIIYQFAVNRIVREEKPEVIWTSDCYNVSILKYNIKTIYEVIDLYGEMSPISEIREEIFANEGCMLQKADHVVVTSSYIQEFLKNKYRIKDDKISLVRNGVSLKQNFLKKHESKKISGEKVKLAYIGTVANWFDWGVVKYSLDLMPEIEYHLIGPISDRPNFELPEDRIKFYGPIKHVQLSNIAQHMDILVMPFLVNEIVKAVDPVKLYEYVAFAKDIICVKYSEVERFADYVYFYNNKEEFVDSIKKIREEKTIKYSLDHAADFLLQNNWEKRAIAAIQICNEVVNGKSPPSFKRLVQTPHSM